MKFSLAATALAAVLALGSTAGFAHRLSDEERAAARAKWEQMTPEQREAAKQRMAERRAQAKAKWDAMSPEEREAAKQRFAERRAAHAHGDHAPGKDTEATPSN